MLYVAWLLALALLTWGFSGWLDKARNPNQKPVKRVKHHLHLEP